MAATSAAQCIDKGKVAHAYGKHAEALRFLSQAVALSGDLTDTLLTALDLRCQTYYKLGQYDLALKDARHMIHITKRQAAAGYLRCSQIERQRDNFDASLRWLDHGAKNVPQHRKLFDEQRKKVQDVLLRHAMHQKQQDPVSSVPLEVLEIILSYLKYDEVVRLLRVSRTWKNVLSRMKPLTTTLDFSGTRKNVTLQSCNAGLKRLCRRPQKVVLGLLATSATNAMQNWLYKYTNIEALNVLHLDDSRVRCGSLRFDKLCQLQSLQIGSHQGISLRAILHNIAKCPNLRKLTVRGITNENLTVNEHLVSLECFTQPRLQQLRLCAKQESNFIISSSLLASYLGLESLRIERGHIQPNVLDLSVHEQLREACLDLVSQESLDLNLPHHLEELSVSGYTRAYVSHPTIFRIADPVKVPNLRKMTFSNVWACAAIESLAKSEAPPNLQTVRFEDVRQDLLNQKYSQGCSIFQKCSTLSYVSSEMVNGDCDTFATLFPAAETVVIEAPLITGVFVSDFVSRANSKVTQLVLNNCDKVSSDIIGWLKVRGVKCRMTSTDSRSIEGSRLRYQ